MGSNAQYVSILMCVFIILLNHGLKSEGIKNAQKRKYYPEEPPVKTILLDNGDVVDCVDFYSQPAMEDPRIRSSPQLKAIREKNQSHELANDEVGETGVKTVSCPLGSVPFLKATKAGPLNLTASYSFARSRANFFLKSNIVKPQMPPQNNREYAAALVSGGGYRGAQGTFNVWKPILEDRREMSILQVWVLKENSMNAETVEAGWMVQPSLFGDHKARFFYYTTNSTYQCGLYGENNRLPAHDNNLRFVRESNQIPFGMELATSTLQGNQEAITVTIKRNAYGNWDLWHGRVKLGHWPRENYRDLFPVANRVQWGGEIANFRTRGRHTSTQMGSGHFPGEGRGRAAYIRNMGIFNDNNQLYLPPGNIETEVTRPECYDLSTWTDSQVGRYMTLGGPGYNEDTGCL